jgi:prepilin-type N-terminal cleavage/methylation domain-containing protein
MKITQLHTTKRTQGFTLIELLVVISIIAILAGLGLRAFPAAIKKARLTESTSNAKQILLTVKLFASDNDGAYPSETVSPDGGVTPGTPLAAGTFSNKAFDNLIFSGKYPIGKGFFINKNSKYCKSAPPDTTAVQAKTVNKGQCDWMYIAGLSDASPGTWPLITTATKSASDLTYTNDKSALGGVWEGTDAIVGFCDGSARPVSEKEMDQSNKSATFLKSPINGANMLIGTADWLGTGAIVLAPEPSGN